MYVQLFPGLMLLFASYFQLYIFGVLLFLPEEGDAYKAVLFVQELIAHRLFHKYDFLCHQ